MKKEVSDEINWRISFLKNGYERYIEVIESGQKLDDVDREFLEEEIRFLKKWINDLKKMTEE